LRADVSELGVDAPSRGREADMGNGRRRTSVKPSTEGAVEVKEE